MTAATACLIAGALLMVAGVAGLWSGYRPLLLLLRFSPLLALGFLTSALLAAPSAQLGTYGSTRLVLTTLSLSLRDGVPARFGGNAEVDDVVAPGTRVNALSVAAGRAADQITLTTVPEVDVTGARRAITLVRLGGPKGRFLGAREVDGNQLCVRPCGGVNEPFRPDRGRVYPAESFELVGAVGAPRSAVYVMPREGKLVRIDPGSEPVLETIGAADAEAVSLVTAGLGRASRRGEAPTPGRLRVERNFHLTRVGSRLTIQLDRPETQVLRWDGGRRPVVRLASGADAERPTGADEVAAVFPVMGGRFTALLERRFLDVPRDGAPVLHEEGVARALPDLRVSLADQAGAEFLIQPLVFDHGLLRHLGLLLPIALLGGMAATWRLRAEDPLAAVVLAGVEWMISMRLLVAIEGAFVDADPSTAAAVPMALVALSAAPAVLMLCHPDGRRHWRLAAMLAITTAFTAIFCVLGSDDLAPNAQRTARTAVVAVTGLTLAALALSAADLPAKLAAAFDGLAAAIDRWVDGHLPPRWTSLGAGIAACLVGVATLVVARGGFRLAHVQESVQVGVRFSLSLVFVPLTLATFAPLLAAVRREPEAIHRWRYSLTLSSGLALGAGLASWLAVDSGFVIFALPVVMAAFIVAADGEPSRALTVDGLLAATAGAIALTGLVVAVRSDAAQDFAIWTVIIALAIALAWLLAVVLKARVPTWMTGRGGALWLAPASVSLGIFVATAMATGAPPSRSAQVDITRAVELRDNSLRLFAAFDPGKLALVGTDDADALQDTIAHMREYGQTLEGRGYFNLPEPTTLRRYHLTDNVSAVHLISPFGRIGALAFLVIPAAMAAAALIRVPRDDARPSHLLALLAGLTLFLVSAYMVLVNLVAAPFTGRNVYLLAAGSISDLLEGLMLAALVLIGLGVRRPAPP